MVAKRSTKMGKVMPYVDVRSNSDVPKFESMIKAGPVFVLVYADWCGHCTRFKQSMWDEVAKSNQKKVNAAAVHYNMVDKTSMKNANIEGYPTLFEVKSSSTPPTPVATPQSKEALETLVGSNGTNSSNVLNESTPVSTWRGETPLENTESFVPEPIESLPPALEEETLPSVSQKGGARGGSLFETLLKISADAAHAVVLTGSAIEISKRMKKRRATKRKSSGKRSFTRRR
jgi:thiol-disulfide isomerase/thioredoxin